MDYGDSALHTSAQPGRAVPFSLEAEQSVLGAILLEPSCLNVVMDLLPREEYFYGVNNQLIYGNRAGAVGNYSFATRTGGKASHCIACGQCEAACPQHIEIIEELKKAVEMFEG